MAQMQDPVSRTTADSAAARLEWIVAAVSAVIVLALTGFILYEALVKTGSEPDLRFTVQRGFAMSDGYVIRAMVHNDGRATVSNVDIAAEARQPDVSPETASVTIDYLPAESSTEIGLIFSFEVDPAHLQIRALGYTYP
ncbi:MAG TPA: hypothetical protein VNS12_05025 [Pelagibacterium sp.]|uniref:hypothetical protein n=1 Tax=Pelagibacterium sp. TaxID=1967288 RepID=UPI002CDF1B32|nr:hypothetical protein [Pelagibacterium sp.]HWJ87413.1 hypothetical protein [Pelagibacterium sp.]